MHIPLGYTLNAHHFAKLAEVRGESCGWTASKHPSRWAVHVGVPKDIAVKLPDSPVDRSELAAYCAKEDAELSALAVLAWGGMKLPYGRLAYSGHIWPNITQIIDEMRSKSLSRSEAYQRFANFRRSNPRSGLGPAYFTKLIFFLNEDHAARGYIMDQWTSLSINLLFAQPDRPLIKMQTSAYRGRRTDTVSDANTAQSYENFCLCIEYLAAKLGLNDPSTAEEWIFSRGGRNPAPWRAYVQGNRPAPKAISSEKPHSP